MGAYIGAHEHTGTSAPNSLSHHLTLSSLSPPQRLQTEPEAVKQLAKDLYGLEQRMQEMIAEVCSIAAAQGPQAG